MTGTATNHYKAHRFRVADFHHVGEAGILPPDVRVELIEGEIVDMPPIGSRHAGTVTFLSYRLNEGIGRSALLSVQNPVVLDDFNELQPDIAVLRRRDDFYARSHPGPEDVLLLVEVAETTLPYDRDKKLPLYARAKVPEVWVVDVNRAAFHIFRDPEGDEYRDQRITIAPVTMTLAMLPDTVIDLSGFFDS